ncbi:MAG: flagellar biosynthetic protein FliR [Lachnospiraceae bacterium]|jgi:flagellar biosynthetic protein FliR|nr:flagellar biosynthetic protein FliR [Lachnospiraceae bacterium]
MIHYSFSVYDLEYFLLILVRVVSFVHTAPFLSMSSTPSRVRIALSFFTSLLLYQALTPAEAVVYSTVTEYAVIVMKEAIVGLLVGFAASICSSIVNFAGSIADMEVGLSMMTLMDPTSRQSTSITGVLYQYVLMLMMMATGMYRYFFRALADTYILIPVNGAIFRSDSLLNSMMEFLGDYVIIGFRIILPIFCSILLLNAVLGILARVAPQLNMFAVGIQLKVLVGLSIIFLTVEMLPLVADFIFDEMKRMIVSFMGGMT